MKKIKTNLFVNGEKVISYNTHVATIKGKKLLVNGTYSNTTSKHITHIANLYGLSIEKKEGKPKFDKLPVGTIVQIHS